MHKPMVHLGCGRVDKVTERMSWVQNGGFREGEVMLWRGRYQWQNSHWTLSWFPNPSPRSKCIIVYNNNKEYLHTIFSTRLVHRAGYIEKYSQTLMSVGVLFLGCLEFLSPTTADTRGSGFTDGSIEDLWTCLGVFWGVWSPSLISLCLRSPVKSLQATLVVLWKTGIVS